MTLHLIRHGLTLANEQRLYCGSTDVPLAQAGEQGILALAAQGIYPPADGLALYTSGMLRARQTLRLIYGDVRAPELPAFAEMCFGAFEMHSHEQLKDDPAYLRWVGDTAGETPCPGGESAAAFRQRVLAALDGLLALDQPALLVCHGGVIVRIMERLFPDEPRHFYQWQPKSGQGYTVCIDACGSRSFRSISPAP